MNILHHKSWHVRNKDNIQRVKRDEAKAAEEEKERLKRQSLAESEARLNVLRNRSKISEYDKQEIQFVQSEHINLFESAEQGKNINATNKEVDREKKDEKEKFEKKIGLLKYLVDEDLDVKTQPWYKVTRKSIEDGLEVDLKSKLSADPLKDMESALKDRDKAKKRKRHGKHKHYHHEKSNKHTKEEADDKPVVKKSKTIEELRAERMKREAEERTRANKLLYGLKEVEVKEKVELDDRKRRYNNQFNPEISKY